MDYKFLSIEKRDHIATCVMSNPPTHTMVAEEANELYLFLEAIEEDADTRVIVFTGAGEDVFIKHYEVGELSKASDTAIDQTAGSAAEPSRGPSHGLREVIVKMESMDLMTIAAINGSTMGGGLEFALGCDFRLQRQGRFRLGLPEIGVGILPGGGGTQRLARMLGTAKALDLILLGQTYSPDEAFEMGIVSRLMSNEHFSQDVADFAATLAKRAPRALANAKRAIREGIEMSLEDGLTLEGRLFAELLETEDAALAMKALLAGEDPPEFKGR
jgi:enoyl-CoA hydratase/carnithine racemase